jgi:hypothetical protein
MCVVSPVLYLVLLMEVDRYVVTVGNPQIASRVRQETVMAARPVVSATGGHVASTGVAGVTVIVVVLLNVSVAVQSVAVQSVIVQSASYGLQAI